MITKIYYHLLILITGRRSFIYYLFLLEHLSDASLPSKYTNTERYFIWCEYIDRKASGEKITYSDVELEYLNSWNDYFQKQRKDI